MNANGYSTLTTWRYTTAAWLTLGMFDAAQIVVSMHSMGMHHAWLRLFLVETFNWTVWACATPAVLVLLKRFRLPSREATSWLVHGAACVAIGAAWAAWSALLEHASNPFAYANGGDAYGTLLRFKFFGNLVGDVILYGAVVALHNAVDARHRLAQQQAASARLAELLALTQLATLRLQLEPHFIFNSLNAVTGLIRADKGNDAIAMVAALGDLLRRVTDRSESQFIVLEEEADFLRKYLDIQQMRFAERLRYRLEIPAELMRAQVPDFILQPLVENAVKHGIAKRTKGGDLTVMARRDGAALTLNVYNDGPALPDEIKEGVGISNARQRLLALYGQAHTFMLQNSAGTGVLATITLPYREA